MAIITGSRWFGFTSAPPLGSAALAARAVALAAGVETDGWWRSLCRDFFTGPSLLVRIVVFMFTIGQPANT